MTLQDGTIGNGYYRDEPMLFVCKTAPGGDTISQAANLREALAHTPVLVLEYTLNVESRCWG